MTAIQRDGTELNMGDEVTLLENFHKDCNGHTFVICEITPYAGCESGYHVVVHLKGDPERKLAGLQKEGYFQDIPLGVDANWFRLIEKHHD